MKGGIAVALYKDGKEIMGTDGSMRIDGRLNAASVRQVIIDRNKRYRLNFPHLVADAYAVHIGGNFSSKVGPIIKL